MPLAGSSAEDRGQPDPRRRGEALTDPAMSAPPARGKHREEHCPRCPRGTAPALHSCRSSNMDGRSLIVAVALVATPLCPRASHADQGSPADGVVDMPSPSPAPAPARTWYGYQLILSDAASFALAATAKNDRFRTAGALSLIVTPLIIHAANQRRDLAGYSALLRVGLPFFFGLMGAGVTSDDEDQLIPGLDGFVKGALVGFVVGMVVDWCIASKPVHDGASVGMADGKPRRSRGGGVLYGIAPLRDGASLVVGGQF